MPNKKKDKSGQKSLKIPGGEYRLLFILDNEQ